MKQNKLSPYLFILPIFILFSVFIVYPIIYNFIISFYKWNGISIEKEFVGFSNYIDFIKNPVFIKILRNFFFFAVFTIVTQAVFGMAFASFFINKIKLSNIYRIIFYIPVVATPAIVGNIYSKIFETNRGFLNEVLKYINLDGLTQQWLAEPKWALICIIYVNIWQWTGYSMLMYYANMLNIPSDVYEAATIDGANKIQQFFRITFPLLRGTHFTLFILGAIGSLKSFDIPFVLTKGGPNHATEFFATYIQKTSFDLFKQGESSTVVVIMFIIAMIITAFQMRLYRRQGKM